MIPSLGIALFGAVATSVIANVLIWSLKSTVLLIVAAVVTYVWRHESASRRHAVWCVAVAATVAIPCLAGTLPGWHALPCFNWGAMGPFESAGQVVTSRTQLDPNDQMAEAANPFASPLAYSSFTNDLHDSPAVEQGSEQCAFQQSDHEPGNRDRCVCWPRYSRCQQNGNGGVGVGLHSRFG